MTLGLWKQRPLKAELLTALALIVAPFVLEFLGAAPDTVNRILVLGLFGIKVPYIHESGIIGIGFSLFVVVIAALNLVLDFDFIESGVEAGAPKYMEWFGAFGLMVTLVWLYIEFLRLLAKLRE